MHIEPGTYKTGKHWSGRHFIRNHKKASAFNQQPCHYIVVYLFSETVEPDEGDDAEVYMDIDLETASGEAESEKIIFFIYTTRACCNVKLICRPTHRCHDVYHFIMPSCL